METRLIIYFVAVFINCIAYFLRVRFDVKRRLLEKTVLIVYVISLAVMLLEPLIFFDRFWKFVILVSVAIIIATLGIEPVDKNKH